MSSLPDSRLRVALFSGIGLLVAVALVIAGMMLAQARSVATAHSESQQLWIAVCGHGKAKAAPDQAQLDLGVFGTATTVHDVRVQVSQTMSNVLASIKSNGSLSRISKQGTYRYSRNTTTRAVRRAFLGIRPQIQSL